MSKEYKKYMNVYGNWWPVTVIFVFFILMAVISNENGFEGGAFWVAVCTAALAFLSVLIPLLTDLRNFKRVKEDPAFFRADTEFKYAKSVRGLRRDSVRFGDNYLFIKHSGMPLRYDEIKTVYVRKAISIDHPETLEYSDSKGKHHTICAVGGIVTNDVVNTIKKIILQKNPGVKILSYKKS